jgi:hypothetical protein
MRNALENNMWFTTAICVRNGTSFQKYESIVPGADHSGLVV